MNTGAEPKKIAILVGLLVVAGGVLYYNVFAGDSESPRPITPAPVIPDAPQGSRGVATTARAKKDRRGNGATKEMIIREGREPGQAEPDPATIDPTLRLDLLAKVQQVEMPANLRNIFQYGAAPPPKPVELPKNVPKIPVNQPAAPPPVAPGPPPKPPDPQAPPLTFKYYGYKVSKSDGRKEAFLLDGEDIIVAGENDEVKRGRYKIVKIGNNSITIEDTQFRSSQTLQMEEAPPA